MSEQTEPTIVTIENATRDDGEPGDYIIWTESRESDGVAVTVRREGVAHHRSSDGDWCTEEGMRITFGEGEGITITIHRAVPGKEGNQ